MRVCNSKMGGGAWASWMGPGQDKTRKDTGNLEFQGRNGLPLTIEGSNDI